MWLLHNPDRTGGGVNETPEATQGSLRAVQVWTPQPDSR